MSINGGDIFLDIECLLNEYIELKKLLKPVEDPSWS